MAAPKGTIPWNKKKSVALNCKSCREKFLVRPYRAKIAKFCSHSCYSKSLVGKNTAKRKKEMHCLYCRTMFEYWQCESSRSFCSVECRLEYVKNDINRVCIQYMKEFRTKTFKDTRFCSISCARKFSSGSRHHNWKGGVTPVNRRIRSSARFKRWRQEVFKRDDFTCQKCGDRGVELHPDHVMPFAYFPELRFDVLNGRTLCVPCHRQTETWGRSKITNIFPELNFISS